jgi:hypothetical protein
MLLNRADIVIPQTVIDEVANYLNEIKTLLAPYVVSLTDQERRDILKMSDKSQAFVNKVVDYANTNPEFIPPYMSKANLDIDFDNVMKLDPVMQIAMQVCDQISDTKMVSGNEAFIEALTYYNMVKQADKNGVANARSIYEDLQKRFPGRPKKAKPAEPVA